MEKSDEPVRLIVAMEGNRGLLQGAGLLDRLSDRPGVEVHLVVSETCRESLSNHEESVSALEDRATARYDDNNIGAPMASGSWSNVGMLIMPCSASLIGRIATGLTGSLISRAADVTLKERRPLVVVPFVEAYSLPDLNNMRELVLAGGEIYPPLSDILTTSFFEQILNSYSLIVQ